MGLFLIAYSGIEQPIFSLHRPLAKPGVSKILITGTSLTVIMYKKENLNFLDFLNKTPELFGFSVTKNPNGSDIL